VCSSDLETLRFYLAALNTLPVAAEQNRSGKLHYRKRVVPSVVRHPKPGHWWSQGRKF